MSTGRPRCVSAGVHLQTLGVTDAQSPNAQFPELSVAAFNKNPSGVNEPDGVVCVWNLHLLERPEFVFHSQVRSQIAKLLATSTLI